MRIVVSGMLAGVPGHGGATWSVLQYVLGLRRLRHEVCLVEPVSSIEAAAARYFEAVRERFGLPCAALVEVAGSGCAGSSRRDVDHFAEHADVLINVSGMLRDEALRRRIPVQMYLDLDPAFNQMWADGDGIDTGFEGHTHFVTVGLAVGDATSRVPTCGREWMTTLPPVLLDEWPVAEALAENAFTTVGNWRAYGSVIYEGVAYGQKAHSLRRLAGLPSKTRAELRLALAIHPGEKDDLQMLAENGWTLVDPALVAATPDAYRRFVAGSKGEFGLAKAGYVDSQSGWFSDRSACYLASGRPVVAQDTGWTRHLPTGEGLLAFADEDAAAAALDDVEGSYDRHRRAARELAETLFDSDKVLGRLLACL